MPAISYILEIFLPSKWKKKKKKKFFSYGGGERERAHK